MRGVWHRPVLRDTRGDPRPHPWAPGHAAPICFGVRSRDVVGLAHSEGPLRRSPGRVLLTVSFQWNLSVRITVCSRRPAAPAADLGDGDTGDRVTMDQQPLRGVPRRLGPTSLRSLVLTAVVAVGMAVLAPHAPASAAAPDTWTAPYGDGGNTRYNPGETGITAATAARVSTAWMTDIRSSSPAAPPVVDGAALRVVSPDGVFHPSRLTGMSPVTGETLWSVELPASAQYQSGVTVVGSLAVVPFRGWQRAGGVIVVDLQTRGIRWVSELPPSTISWSDNSIAGRAYSDGERIYLSGSSNGINAFRLSDGALVWTAPVTFDSRGVPHRVDSLALGDDVVFTGGESLIAYEAATGRRLWSAAATRMPVVAAGQVDASRVGAVVAFPAAGCGRATCDPLWTAQLRDPFSDDFEIAGADADELFVTYDNVIARLSAATGRVEWSATAGRATVGPVRAGGMIWLNNEYDDNGTIAQRILGFSTSATGSAPLRAIPLTSNLRGFPQNLGVAAGTLFQQLNGHMVGYRVADAPAPAPNVPPTADFTTEIDGLSVLVDGEPSRDPDGQVKTYRWDFGDGTTASNNVSAHTYATAGSYPVTLTVTDWQGASSSTTRSVTVSAPAESAFAVDGFGRSVSGGLGSAEVGGAWSPLYGASRQSVSDGAARFAFTKAGTSAGAYLGGVSQPSADVTATVVLDEEPTGGGAYFFLIGRRTGTDQDYRLRARFLGDGTVRLMVTVRDGSPSERFIGREVVVAGLDYEPGTPLHLRFQVSGSGTTTLAGKAWTGDSEPEGWTLTRSDATASVQGAGSVGMTAYLSGSATGVPLAFTITDFRARPVA